MIGNKFVGSVTLPSEKNARLQVERGMLCLEEGGGDTPIYAATWYVPRDMIWLSLLKQGAIFAPEFWQWVSGVVIRKGT